MTTKTQVNNGLHLISPATQGHEAIFPTTLSQHSVNARAPLLVVSEGRVELHGIVVHREHIRKVDELRHHVGPHQPHLVTLNDERSAVSLVQTCKNIMVKLVLLTF